MSETIHIHPTAPLAERVLLPGDPGRALVLAQALLDQPKMFNHNRGLWGYSGSAKLDGEPLSIQSTGMGGPSAAIVASELIDLGARRLLRVGTCGALDSELDLGDLLIAVHALADDGTSIALGAVGRVAADEGLVRAAASAGQACGRRVHAGTVVSTDLFYDTRSREREWAAHGALAVEMECAALFALAGSRKVSAAAVLAVSDALALVPGSDGPQRRRIEAEALREAELRLGEFAIATLAADAATLAADAATLATDAVALAADPIAAVAIDDGRVAQPRSPSQ